MTEASACELSKKAQLAIERALVGGAENMAHRDLLALGCDTVKAGKVEAGRKACRAALDALGIGEAAGREILDYLPGHEHELAELVKPHAEIGRALAG